MPCGFLFLAYFPLVECAEVLVLACFSLFGKAILRQPCAGGGLHGPLCLGWPGIIHGLDSLSYSGGAARVSPATTSAAQQDSFTA